MSTQGIDMLLNSGSSSTSGVSSRNATDGMPPELLNVNAVSVSERMQQLILQCQNTGGNPTTADFKNLAAALQSLTNDVERYAEAKGKAEAARAAEKKKLQRPEKILPEASRNKLIQIKKAIQEAPVCHCLSVRDMKHSSEEGKPGSCDPYRTACNLKAILERAPGVFVFDPNTDNVVLACTDFETTAGTWLLTWRDALQKAKETGGKLIQIVTRPGLSLMQEQEEAMAGDKSMTVLRLDCTKIKDFGDYDDFKELEGWDKLMALANYPAEMKNVADVSFGS